MKNSSFSYWLVAIIIGSLVNIGLFLFLPGLGRTEPPKAPQIIELDFIAWQKPVQKTIAKPKKTVQKQKKPEKPKPKKKKIEPPPKQLTKKTITPQPVLSETVIPNKSEPAAKPQPIAEEPEAPTFPSPKDAEVSEDALPTPEPIFKLTSLPRMIHRQKPVYPLEMRQLGKEATVKLEILLDIKGKIRKITIKKSAGDAFDQAAIDAIKGSSFMPANIEGKPVAVLMKIPVRFRLR